MEKTKKKLKVSQSSKELTFAQHANELRIRILISLLLVFVVFCVLFSYSDFILKLIISPLLKLGFKVYSLKVAEKLTATLKASFFASLIVSSPAVLWLIIGFIMPALRRREKIYFLLILIGGLVLIAVGFYFSYKILIPVSLNYLLTFGSKDIQNMITIQFYLDFFLVLFFSTGIGFQLPLVMLLLSKIGIINYRMLSKGRGVAIIIILIVAAVVTPTPDIFTQLALAVPLYILYELGFILTFLFRKRAKEIK